MLPKTALQVGAGHTELPRFNALRHGVLSRYTVLPWEDETEYQSLLGALLAEHSPNGPTEEHLVEELAGIFWRKRRLRLAELAAHHRGPEDTTAPFRDTVGAALVHLGTGQQIEGVSDAIRATDRCRRRYSYDAEGAIDPAPRWNWCLRKGIDRAARRYERMVENIT